MLRPGKKRGRRVPGGTTKGGERATYVVAKLEQGGGKAPERFHNISLTRGGVPRGTSNRKNRS